jgi:hypothetical protein
VTRAAKMSLFPKVAGHEVAGDGCGGLEPFASAWRHVSTGPQSAAFRTSL